MPTSKSIFALDDKSKCQLEFFKAGEKIVIQNNNKNDQFFCINLSRSDWKEICDFIENQFKKK